MTCRPIVGPKRATGLEPVMGAWKAPVLPATPRPQGAEYRFGKRGLGYPDPLRDARDEDDERAGPSAVQARRREPGARCPARLRGRGGRELRRGRVRRRLERHLHPHRRPGRERAVGDAQRDGADRRAGGHVPARLRALSPLLPLAGEPAERPVHAQPPGAREPSAVRWVVDLRPARGQRPPDLDLERRLLQHPRRQVHERLRAALVGPLHPARLGRVVREDLRGPAVLQLPGDREDLAHRRPLARVLRGPAERVPDGRTRAEGRRLRRRPERGADAVLDEPLVQRAPLSLRPRAAAPLQPCHLRPAEAPGVQRAQHRRQAEVAAQAGQEPDPEAAREDDHRGAATATGDAALGRRGGRCADRPPGERGSPRRDLHRLRLGQRLLPRGAPDRRRQVPRLRPLVEDPADDPWAGYPGGNCQRRACLRARHHPDHRGDRDRLVNPNLDGRSLIPYARDATLRSTRPILLEADTGPGNAPPGSTTPRRARPARSLKPPASPAAAASATSTRS